LQSLALRAIAVAHAAAFVFVLHVHQQCSTTMHSVSSRRRTAKLTPQSIQMHRSPRILTSSACQMTTALCQLQVARSVLDACDPRLSQARHVDDLGNSQFNGSFSQ
jgi:hypothetical protein